MLDDIWFCFYNKRWELNLYTSEGWEDEVLVIEDSPDLYILYNLCVLGICPATEIESAPLAS